VENMRDKTGNHKEVMIKMMYLQKLLER